MSSFKRLTLVSLTVFSLISPRALAQAHDPEPKALKAFAEMIHAYRKRPALTVKTTVTIELTQNEAKSKSPPVEAEFILGKRGVGLVKLRGFTCYLSNGRLAAIHESTDHSYVSIPDDDSPYYALMSVFNDMPFPHLAIAFGEDDIESVCMQFHQKAPWVQPTAVSTVTVDGKTLQQLKLTSDFDDLTVLLDPKTKLMQSIDLLITGGNLVQPGATLRYHHEFEYETPDAPLDESIFAFDPGERQRADALMTLVARAAVPQGGGPLPGAEAGALVGQPAPGFVLETADGAAVDLEDLRGRVVVLDFWATWCGPCRIALPLLHEVAEWANDEALPVEVLTINVWEARGQGGAPNARLDAVTAYWTKEGYSLPVLMDYTDETPGPYLVQGIPTTVIIRADGIVHAHHVGVVPDYVQTLKRQITEAMEAVEVPGR